MNGKQDNALQLYRKTNEKNIFIKITTTIFLMKEEH